MVPRSPAVPTSSVLIIVNGSISSAPSSLITVHTRSPATHVQSNRHKMQAQEFVHRLVKAVVQTLPRSSKLYMYTCKHCLESTERMRMSACPVPRPLSGVKNVNYTVDYKTKRNNIYCSISSTHKMGCGSSAPTITEIRSKTVYLLVDGKEVSVSL